MDNPILIHAQALKGAAFGDKRLEKRGQHCTQRFANTNQLVFVRLVAIEQSRWATTAF
jgi:hypothetical protein